MSNLNAEYYFVLEDRDERIPATMPDADTAKMPYTYKALPLHAKPLVFRDGLAEDRERNGIPSLDPPPEVLFHGSDLLVKDEVRDVLLSLRLPYLAIQPAIFIDHKLRWHEDYWYLTFLELLDCWDREASVFNPDAPDIDGVRTFQVYVYSLNQSLLEKTPMHLRLLFKMGGTNDGFVVVHRSLAGHFRVSGAVLVPIADFGMNWP